MGNGRMDGDMERESSPTPIEMSIVVGGLLERSRVRVPTFLLILI